MSVPEQVTGLVTEATSSSAFRRWYWLIRLVVIAVPVMGATPTALNLYYAWKHGIPYSQVSHRLQQYNLWVKNGACNIEYKEISAARDAKVNIGACPTTGDISIQVSLTGGRSILEWIDFNELQQMNTAHDFLTTPAFAEEAPAAVAGTLATRFAWVETVVEAALERSRDKFIQALILDGAVQSPDTAVALADDLLQAQAAYLRW